MRKIKITKGLFTIVDDADFAWLNQYKWQAEKRAHLWYVRGRINDKLVYMHRFIMNPKKGFVIDHKDRDGLNNTRDNLRVCTISNNMVNQRPQINGSSKFLGVSWDKERGKWKAQCCKMYKTHIIGRFETEEQAALAYNKKAVELHGQFANLNRV